MAALGLPGGPAFPRAERRLGCPPAPLDFLEAFTLSYFLYFLNFPRLFGELMVNMKSFIRSTLTQFRHLNKPARLFLLALFLDGLLFSGWNLFFNLYIIA